MAFTVFSTARMAFSMLQLFQTFMMFSPSGFHGVDSPFHRVPQVMSLKGPSDPDLEAELEMLCLGVSIPLTPSMLNSRETRGSQGHCPISKDL